MDLPLFMRWSIADKRWLQILFNETEKLLDKWKHPDPYRPPTAPGGE
jgi:NADH dehydrogenase (ubiquinone) 1 beta subcomplex subunit 9